MVYTIILNLILAATALPASADCNPKRLPSQLLSIVHSEEATGTLSCPRPSTAFNSRMQNVISSCEKSIAEVNSLTVPATFIDEHVFNDDPKKVESNAIAGTLKNRLPTLALCSQFANSPSKEQSAVALKNFILKWFSTYRGDGNPINEAHLIPIFQAALWANLKFSKQEKGQFDSALKNLNLRLDSFWNSTKNTDSRRFNNWMTESLVTQSYAAELIGDRRQIEAVKSRLNQHLQSEYSAPSNWTPSGCQNLASIGQYGSYDLQERDALLYHVKGFGRAFELESFLPQFIENETTSRLLKATNLTKDFVIRKKSHSEFKCTNVKFDKDRGAHGLKDYTVAPWDPLSNREAFRFARMVNPSVRPWTATFANDHYPAWMLALAACYGDQN